jgi:hypothetical protein
MFLVPVHAGDLTRAQEWMPRPKSARSTFPSLKYCHRLALEWRFYVTDTVVVLASALWVPRLMS